MKKELIAGISGVVGVFLMVFLMFVVTDAQDKGDVSSEPVEYAVVEEDLGYEAEVAGVEDHAPSQNEEDVEADELDEDLPEESEGEGPGEASDVPDDTFVPSTPAPQPEPEPDQGGTSYTPDIDEEERWWKYTSVHQMDESQHLGETFDFEAVADGKEAQSSSSLSVYLDYTPPQNEYLNKTVMGFAPYWALDGYYQNYQMDNLSIIAYFGVDCYPDGSLVKNNSGWTAWNSTVLADMVTKAHENDVKVVLTVKNFDKASIETFIASSAARSKLTGNIVSEIEAKNIDGVNIDFEYISTATSTQRSQFTAFVDQVADAVHAARPGSHVSVDIIGSSAISTLLYDVAALGKTSVDAIMVMAYDFHTTRYYDGKLAGPVSPLYGDQYWYTVSEAMNDITAKAPASKVIMGVPYYGLEFPVSESTWLTKNAAVISNGSVDTYKNIVDPKFDAWHNSSTIQWDSGEKMRWYRYRWPDPVSGPGYSQGYYEDATSLKAKYDYVLNKNLAGIGIWALGYDNGYTELWGAIRDKFSKEPILVYFKEDIPVWKQNQIHDALGAEFVMRLSDERAVVVRPITKKSYDLILAYRARSEVLSADFLKTRNLALKILDD